MRKVIAALFVFATMALLVPAAADAQFGLRDVEVTFDPSPPEAGGHPTAMTTSLKLNRITENVGGEDKEFIDGALRSLEVRTPPGLVANPTAVPRCSTLDFLTKPGGPFELPECANSTALGIVKVAVCEETKCSEGGEEPTVVYNLEPPPGTVARLGFWALNTPVTVLLQLTPEPPYRGRATIADAPQVLEVAASELVIWGSPADSSHDLQRGKCLRTLAPDDACPAGIGVRPFLTLPRSCTGPYETVFRAEPWWTGDFLNPTPGGAPFEETVETAPGGTDCGALKFSPSISTQPTTDNASSPSGLDVAVEIDDEGIDSSSGRARSEIRKAILALPKGVTINPSQAEGLATCSQADLARETVSSAPGAGCPQAAKIGTLEVETPIIEDKVFRGQVFVATQGENPFGTLIALYMVIKDPELGVLVKLAGKVEPDPVTGQIVTTVGEPGHEVPQFPVSDFRFHFREGGRSPLITPERCGTYTTVARLTPWANPAKTLTTTSDFQITGGVGGGPCPPAGPPPFVPGFEAGSINNHAGAHTAFNARLTRRDGDQDLVRLSTTLPKGVVARIAGTTQCPDASIAMAKTRTGKAEIAAPSCPASSRIGTIVGGAGVGSQLTYVKGSAYMAGPFGGAPLSMVSIVPAVAGPFDVGTVVTRFALQFDPRTAEVRVDGAASDPIPHILAGIPLKVRDLRADVDRPSFALNPTSCDPSAVRAEIWGGGLDPFSTADDGPVFLSSRFQAAGCASLDFKPKLALNLKGGTRRGAFPALTTILTPRPGDANLEDLVLRLPRSAFLEQGHFRTICTRVLFAAGAGNGEQCPRGSVYGTVKVWTPILDEPAQGHLYLRSSSHDLPDIVLALQGPPSVPAKVEVTARVDSHKGGIRVSARDVPDLPVSKAIVITQGGQKGLIVNSRNLCAKPSRANVQFTAQNEKRRTMRPVVRATSCKQRKRAKRR